MLRTTAAPIVSATRTVCTRAPAAILARPSVLTRSISTGITKPSIAAFSVPKPKQQQQRTMSSNYNQGELSTFGFQERQPSEGEKQMVEDVLKLYQLKPTSAVYARYAPDSQFHDPIGLAKGLDAIKAQFNAMASSFKRSDTIAVKYLENPEVKPPSVQFALSQHYVIGSTEKTVNSKITLHVDPSSNLIKQHDEEWDGKPNTTGEDGFMGSLNEMRKKVTASVVKAATDQTPPTEKK